MQAKHFNSDTLEENIDIATRLFSESSAAMVEMYRTQFKLSHDVFTNFMNMRVAYRKDSENLDFESFRLAFESQQKNFQNFFELSKKNILTVLNAYVSPLMGDDTQRTIESILKIYNLQIKQIAAINQKLLETFNETFKITNENFTRNYAILQDKIKEDFRLTQNTVNNTTTTYSPKAIKSVNDMQQMFDVINKQMELFIRNNFKFWSDLFQTPEIEENETNTKKQENKKNNKSQLKSTK